jgi:single-strand DNA-binding protein
MNNIDLVGNVGQHPVLRHTGNGTPVANVSLATNRVYKDGAGNRQQTTEWHRLVIWGEPATTLAKIVGRGDLLAVRGRLEYKQRDRRRDGPGRLHPHPRVDQALAAQDPAGRRRRGGRGGGGGRAGGRGHDAGGRDRGPSVRC